MIGKEVVNCGIDYILRHLDEEISIEDVAAHCHFSKYYFSRLFKAETGESIYSFIKRMKMDRSAIMLKLEKGKSITDIAAEYGYSSSNYSTAFKQQHHISPAEFRKAAGETLNPSPFYETSSNRYLSFEEYDRRIEIRKLGECRVIYDRYIGNYADIKDNWVNFTRQYGAYMGEDTLLIERSYNDPMITDLKQCIYDLCMTAGHGWELENTTVLTGGNYAVYRYCGPVEDIYPAFQGMYQIWLAGSRYEMDDSYGLSVYHVMDWANLYVEMDFCIPVVRR